MQKNLDSNVLQKNISFFAKPYFFGPYDSDAHHLFLHRGSSMIRGEQVAKFMGAKYNPNSGFENDVCIYLKPRTVKHIKDDSYVDIIDGGDYFIKELKRRPKIKVITSTLISYKLLKKILINKVIYIPQHHCNFERFKRARKEMTTAGMITHPSGENFLLAQETKNILKKIGIKFITSFYYQNREDVVNFYKKIDLQVIGCFNLNNANPFKHPLKLINAASFGIPTITNWMLGYGEFEDYYIPVKNMESLVKEVEKMKDKNTYNHWAEKIAKKAEEYHIDRIAELYKDLK